LSNSQRALGSSFVRRRLRRCTWAHLPVGMLVVIGFPVSWCSRLTVFPSVRLPVFSSSRRFVVSSSGLSPVTQFCVFRFIPPNSLPVQPRLPAHWLFGSFSLSIDLFDNLFVAPSIGSSAI